MCCTPKLASVQPTTHSTAQHGTAQHSTARHGTAQHSTAQHSTAQHSTAQHSMLGEEPALRASGVHSWSLPGMYSRKWEDGVTSWAAHCTLSACLLPISTMRLLSCTTHTTSAAARKVTQSVSATKTSTQVCSSVQIKMLVRCKSAHIQEILHSLSSSCCCSISAQSSNAKQCVSCCSAASYSWATDLSDIC